MLKVEHLMILHTIYKTQIIYNHCDLQSDA